MAMYVDIEHRTWVEVLPFVTFAYTTAVQETTGFSLFQLVHGRQGTPIVDAMLPLLPHDDDDIHENAQLASQRAEEAR